MGNTLDVFPVSCLVLTKDLGTSLWVRSGTAGSSSQYCRVAERWPVLAVSSYWQGTERGPSS